jgi:hypothetical protein
VLGPLTLVLCPLLRAIIGYKMQCRVRQPSARGLLGLAGAPNRLSRRPKAAQARELGRAHFFPTESHGRIFDEGVIAEFHSETAGRLDAVFASTPIRMIFSIPCCLSCWSRSVLAKPLCAQCFLMAPASCLEWRASNGCSRPVPSGDDAPVLRYVD